MLSFKVYAQVGLVLTALVLGACGKTKHSAKATPTKGGQELTPVPPATPTATDSRVRVGKLEIDGDLVREYARLGYYGALDTEYSCADLVQVTTNGKTEYQVELINSEDCTIGSDTLFPQSSVKYSLPTQKGYGTNFVIYAPGTAKPIGQFVPTYSSSKLTGGNLTMLCTGAYYYENSGGACIVTTEETAGTWDELYIW